MATLRTIRPLRALAAIALAACLAACTAPAPQGSNGMTGEPAVHAPDPAPEPVAGPAPTQPVKKPPPKSKPLPPQRVGDGAVVLDRSCKTDADCAVKDVGNCCGYYPACVNKDSPTDPAAVKAQCAASGMSSVCGFAEISSCSCNAGKCESAGGRGVSVAQ